jgi:uncharacterized membrane protein
MDDEVQEERRHGRRGRRAVDFQQEYPEMPDEKPRFEQTPLTRTEYITALAHFYRAEMHRSLVWRTRLDTTTNWAIVATLAILTTSLQNPSYAREALLLGMMSNIVFLVIEARRFRFFDVWRARVRMIEENFYGGILRRDQSSPDFQWGSYVADDLLCPRFHLTRLQAFRARLMRNFRFIFFFLLMAWIAHSISPAAEPRGMGLFSHAPWAPDVLVGLFYLVLIGIAIFTPRAVAPEVAYWPDPEHPGEDISSLDV